TSLLRPLLAYPIDLRWQDQDVSFFSARPRSGRTHACRSHRRGDGRVHLLSGGEERGAPPHWRARVREAFPQHGTHRWMMPAGTAFVTVRFAQLLLCPENL